MPVDLAAVSEQVEQFGRGLAVYFSDRWVVLQAGLIIAFLLTALLLRRAVEPRLDGLARRIKGNPDLLRLAIAVVRRTHLAIFVALLWLVRIALAIETEPNRNELVTTVLLLVGSWFSISVLTRIIRNRTLARLVALVVWLYAAMLVFGIEQLVTAALDAAAITLGTIRLSLLMVIRVAIALTALVWLAVFVGNIAAHLLDRMEDISPSLKVLVAKLVRITLVALALVSALTTTGIDLTALTVFSGAIGVGIGFGLQRVVSNFVSGIIILLDRSVKPGDTIELGDTFGWVQELRARFTSVVTRDGRKYLIPNEDLITQQVVNWSYNDPFVRIDVEFGVSYTDDPHHVTAVSTAAASAVPRVTQHKPPVCWMTDFGEWSVNFKLRFWISDPQNGITNIRGQVLLALWDAFKAEGITLPFPQHEIVVNKPIRVNLDSRAVGFDAGGEGVRATVSRAKDDGGGSV